MGEGVHSGFRGLLGNEGFRLLRRLRCRVKGLGGQGFFPLLHCYSQAGEERFQQSMSLATSPPGFSGRSQK